MYFARDSDVVPSRARDRPWASPDERRHIATRSRRRPHAWASSTTSSARARDARAERTRRHSSGHDDVSCAFFTHLFAFLDIALVVVVTTAGKPPFLRGSLFAHREKFRRGRPRQEGLLEVCDSSLHLKPRAEIDPLRRRLRRRGETIDARARAGRGIHRRTARQNSQSIVTERTRSILTHLDARL